MASYSVLRFVATAIRWLSVVAVVFVLAGLLGALTDEVRNSSKVSATRITQVQGGTPQTAVVDITQPDPPADVERLREKQHTAGREVIDDVNDVLMRPFSWIGQDRAPWVQRLIYTGLSLLIYGFLLQVLADQLRLLADRIRREHLSAAEAEAARERRESGTYVSPA